MDMPATNSSGLIDDKIEGDGFADNFLPVSLAAVALGLSVLVAAATPARNGTNSALWAEKKARLEG
jgi:hypothetical protein